jgi:hypothetical protein
MTRTRRISKKNLEPMEGQISLFEIATIVEAIKSIDGSNALDMDLADEPETSFSLTMVETVAPVDVPSQDGILTVATAETATQKSRGGYNRLTDEQKSAKNDLRIAGLRKRAESKPKNLFRFAAYDTAYGVMHRTGKLDSADCILLNELPNIANRAALNEYEETFLRVLYQLNVFCKKIAVENGTSSKALDKMSGQFEAEYDHMLARVGDKVNLDRALATEVLYDDEDDNDEDGDAFDKELDAMSAADNTCITDDYCEDYEEGSTSGRSTVSASMLSGMENDTVYNEEDDYSGFGDSSVSFADREEARRKRRSDRSCGYDVCDDDKQFYDHEVPMGLTPAVAF